MFDLGWSEMGIVLIVALLILGPKELPRLARDIGRWVGKARAMGREFQRSLEDIAREAELDEVKKQIETAGRTNYSRKLEDALDPEGELKSAFDVNTKDQKAAPPKPTVETGPSRTSEPAGPPAPEPAVTAEVAAPVRAERES